jgi:hypothetical protein
MKNCGLIPISVVDGELFLCFKKGRKHIEISHTEAEKNEPTLEQALFHAKSDIGYVHSNEYTPKKVLYTEFEHIYFVKIDKDSVNNKKCVWLNESQLIDVDGFAVAQLSNIYEIIKKSIKK